MNQVNLIGRLGEDVKLHEFENGNKKGSFSLATNEHYKNDEGQNETKTEWHNVVVNNKIADNCHKYIKKGSMVAITGKLQTRNYEKENTKHYVTEIVAQKVTFLDGNNKDVESSEE